MTNEPQHPKKPRKATLTMREKRAAAHQRRERVAARNPREPEPEPPAWPQTPVRVYSELLTVSGSDPNRVRTVMIPLPDIEAKPGRPELSRLESRLQKACSRHVLRAYDLIRETGEISAEDAEERVNLVAPFSLDYMRRIGRGAMESLEFDHLAVDDLTMLLNPDHDLIGAHESIADWLRVALVRVQRIKRASDQASWLKDNERAWQHIQNAYMSAPARIDTVDLIRIAAAADVPSTPLWPQKIDDTNMVEVARFAAKLILDEKRPAELRRARLKRPHLPVARELLGSQPGDQYHNPTAVGLVRRLLRRADPKGRLLEAATCMEIAGLDLVIGEGPDRQERPEWLRDVSEGVTKSE